MSGRKETVVEVIKSLRRELALDADGVEEYHDEFSNGVTIGDFKFKLVVREELTAIRV